MNGVMSQVPAEGSRWDFAGKELYTRAGRMPNFRVINQVFVKLWSAQLELNRAKNNVEVKLCIMERLCPN